MPFRRLRIIKPSGLSHCDWLEVAILTVKGVRDAGSLAPVPYLEKSAEVVLRILEGIKLAIQVDMQEYLRTHLPATVGIRWQAPHPQFRLVDATNVHFVFPVHFFPTFQDFAQYLPSLFRNRMVRELVEQGAYELVREHGSGTISIEPSSWRGNIMDGCTIWMNIVVKQSEIQPQEDSRQCPRCGYLCVYGSLGSEVQCSSCHTMFRVSEAFVEEEESIDEKEIPDKEELIDDQEISDKKELIDDEEFSDEEEFTNLLTEASPMDHTTAVSSGPTELASQPTPSSTVRQMSSAGVVNQKQILNLQYFSRIHVLLDRARRPSPKRKALLIGITYDTSGYGELKGPHADVAVMRRLLVEMYGYRVGDIVVLLDDDAHNDEENGGGKLQPTRVNILRAIDDLVRGARKGDRFFFHYCRDTTRVKNRSSSKVDGMDECLIPVDVENKIMNNELRRHLVAALPVGSSLVAVFDSHYSGRLLGQVFGAEIWGVNVAAADERWTREWTRRPRGLSCRGEGGTPDGHGLALRTAQAGTWRVVSCVQGGVDRGECNQAIGGGERPRVHALSYARLITLSPDFLLASVRLESVPDTPVVWLEQLLGTARVVALGPARCIPGLWTPSRCLVRHLYCVFVRRVGCAIDDTEAVALEKLEIYRMQCVAVVRPALPLIQVRPRTPPSGPSTTLEVAPLQAPNSANLQQHLTAVEPTDGKLLRRTATRKATRRATREDTLEVISLASCNGHQMSWEDASSRSMTREPVRILERDPHLTLRSLITDVSHALHRMSLERHVDTLRYKRDLKKYKAFLERKRLNEVLPITGSAARAGNSHSQTTVEDSVLPTTPGATPASHAAPSEGFVNASVYDMHNFQDPQVASHWPLDMEQLWTM
ncbi:caspase domain-containing protein [Mycena leptocephala]|nr:caspase domain-containing protein [Mycena leptocephala]